MTFYVR